jgi:hypothetical protein
MRRHPRRHVDTARLQPVFPKSLAPKRQDPEFERDIGRMVRER